LYKYDVQLKENSNFISQTKKNMQTFKLELIKSLRVELYIANIFIDYKRKFEILLHRLAAIIEGLDSQKGRSPNVLAALTEKRNRITRNISDINATLERSRARFAEIQNSLIECESLIKRSAHFITKK
jgi:hypothetical protein